MLSVKCESLKVENSIMKCSLFAKSGSSSLQVCEEDKIEENDQDKAEQAYRNVGTHHWPDAREWRF